MGDPVSVAPSAVVPGAVIILSMTAAGGVAFTYFVKNSLAIFQDESAKLDEESTFLGFLSPVHFFAVLYWFFFIWFGLTALFQSNWYDTSVQPNCLTLIMLAGVGYSGAKTAQYAFFTCRMYFVFKETWLAVPPRRMKQIFGVIAFFIIGFDGTIVYVFATGSSSALQAGQSEYFVCPPSDGEFGGVIVVAMLVYIVCDTYVMVSVIYGFVWRLLEIPKNPPVENEAQRKCLEEARDGAFVVLLLAVLHLVSSVSLTLMQMSYVDNMFGFIIPVFDLVVNLFIIGIGLTDVHKGRWLIQNRKVLYLLFALEKQSGVKKNVEMAADSTTLAKHLAEN